MRQTKAFAPQNEILLCSLCDFLFKLFLTFSALLAANKQLRTSILTGDRFPVRVDRWLVQLRSQFSLKLWPQKMLDLFCRRMQVIARQFKVTSHIRFPKPV